YTDWMDSSTVNHHFFKTIQVGTSQQTSDTTLTKSRDVSIRMFPEGGNFIRNLENTFAFELKDDRGYPVDGAIEILYNGKVKGTYQTSWQGKGTGKTDLSGKKEYTVRLASNPESEQKLKISPETHLNLTVTSSPEAQQVKFRCTNNLAKTYYVLMIANDHIEDLRLIKVDGEYALEIRNENLKEGINQLVIMDGNYIPVAERLLFKAPASDMRLPGFDLSGDRFSPRSAVNMKINSADSLRSASIAVVDMSQADEKGRENILITHYLRPYLSGEINGFEQITDFSDSEKTNLLMMTNGWSRYDWTKELSKTPGELIEYKLEKGLNISGKVIRKNKNLPAAQTLVMMHSAKTGILTTTTDDEGYFQINNIDYTDSTTLLFEVQTNKKKKDYQFVFNEPRWLPVADMGSMNVAPTAAITPDLQKNYTKRLKLAEIYDFDGRTYYLGEAVIEDSKIDMRKEESQSIYTSMFSKKIIVDSTIVRRTPYIFDLLSRQFPGVGAGVTQDERMKVYPYIFVYGRTPTILIDDVEMSVYDLQPINVDDIYSVEILSGNQATMLGDYGILVMTKKGSRADYNINPRDFIASKLKGFQELKEFYHPNYEIQQKDYIPDFRPTLFWEPEINDTTNELQYYNHDNTGTIKVIMEGYTKTGKPFRKSAFYTIRK
ncbi:MAG: hypothetical protein WBA74_25250, partial [Cyclobacteriaceae bacterium]